MFRSLRMLLLGFALLASSAAWAAYIRGQVFYSNGEWAHHIVVRLRSDKLTYMDEQTTDPQGKFNFDGLVPSIYVLTIEGQGLKPYSKFIDISVAKMSNELITVVPDRASPGGAAAPSGTFNALDADIPAPAKKEYDAAKKSVEQKDADAAVKQYRKAIQLYPKYSAAYLDLGLLHLEMGKFDDAQSELQSANELNPNNPGGFLALGALLNKQKKFDDAEKALSHGLELNPDVAEGQYELAKTYWASGKWQESEPHAVKAVALAPNMAPPHVLLGNIALRKQDTASAVKEFQEYLRLEPNGPMAGGVKQMIEKIEAGQKK